MAVEILPAVLAPRAGLFRQRLRRAERLAPVIHVDFMDGQFLSQASIPLSTAMHFQPIRRTDVHLMVRQPEDWLPLLARWPTRRVIVHCELGARLRYILAAARANHWLIDLAINPATPIARLERWARYVHGFHVMTVRPGRYGAAFAPAMIERIRRLADRYPRRSITADGGVNVSTARVLVMAGARRLAVGSFLQRASDPTEALVDLRRALRG